MKRLPSDVSPRMATNAVPGLTRRESYSTPLTPGSPFWARTSAPSSRCWKVIARIIGHEEMERCREQALLDLLPASHDYQGHFPPAVAPRYITFMSTGTGPAKYRCAQCDQTATSCDCEKFCCLCQSVLDIRFCEDGLMYCEDCRKACDYKTAD